MVDATVNIKGYHLNEIPKGELGKASKIREEFLEFEDALEQKCPPMAILELADLIGAIEAYAEQQHNITLEDLLQMSYITKRAFASGDRK